MGWGQSISGSVLTNRWGPTHSDARWLVPYEAGSSCVFVSRLPVSRLCRAAVAVADRCSSCCPAAALQASSRPAALRREDCGGAVAAIEWANVRTVLLQAYYPSYYTDFSPIHIHGHLLLSGLTSNSRVPW